MLNAKLLKAADDVARIFRGTPAFAAKRRSLVTEIVLTAMHSGDAEMAYMICWLNAGDVSGFLANMALDAIPTVEIDDLLASEEPAEIEIVIECEHEDQEGVVLPFRAVA